MNSSTKELFPSELEFASEESNAKKLQVNSHLWVSMHMQSVFSGCSELYHFSFPEVLQANDPLFLCRSTFLTIQFSTGWFWANFSANHPDSGWLAHIRQHNLCCTLLKEMACKRSSWVSHKMGENVAFCLFEDSKSNFVTRRLHSHSIWVFSLDSVERNGE